MPTPLTGRQISSDMSGGEKRCRIPQPAAGVALSLEWGAAGANGSQAGCLAMRTLFVFMQLPGALYAQRPGPRSRVSLTKSNL